MTMPNASDYRKRAQECVELAQMVRTPEQRIMLLHIAETWLRLASDATDKFTLRVVAAAPEPTPGGGLTAQ